MSVDMSDKKETSYVKKGQSIDIVNIDDKNMMMSQLEGILQVDN